MKHVIFILALIVCLVSTVLPCSIIGGLEFPLRVANLKSYIFVGEVVGYTDVIKSTVKSKNIETEDKFHYEARGLKIKPITAINLPKVPSDYFELYKFGVTSWCAGKLIDVSYIKIGTKLRIVANEAELLPTQIDNNHIKLESKVFDRFSVIKDDELVSNESLEFDYKNNWKLLRDKFLAAKESEKVTAFDDFIYLETNKDLLRLQNSTSKKERYKILERLVYNSKVNFPVLILPNFGENRFLLLPANSDKERQIKFTRTEKELLKKRKELETSGYFR